MTKNLQYVDFFAEKFGGLKYFSHLCTAFVGDTPRGMCILHIIIYIVRFSDELRPRNETNGAIQSILLRSLRHGIGADFLFGDRSFVCLSEIWTCFLL